MRIIAGKWRGRRLAEPNTMDIRPTTDRAKEGLFNTINYYIEGSDFLDLFSGATTIAFEAKSRGAETVVAVDNSRESKRVFGMNDEKVQSGIEFYNSDVLAYLDREHRTFDYIFMDPPYDLDTEIIDQIMTKCVSKLNPEGQIILEFPSRRRLAFTDVQQFKEKNMVSQHSTSSRRIMNKVVFPGSFDPITLGHLEIIKRLSNKYSKVYVLIGKNDSKQGFLPVEVRKELIEQIVTSYGNIEVIIDEGLVVDFCKKVESKTIIRGVRNVHDFTSEQTLAYNNAHLDDQIETLLIFGRQEYMHISSSGVRELLRFGHSIDHLVPTEVNKYLLEHK